MAAPADRTTRDISGIWTLNLALTGKMDDALRLFVEDIEAVKGKLLEEAKSSQHISHVSKDGVEQITIRKVPCSDPRTEITEQKLDWVARDFEGLFGTVQVSTRRSKAVDIEEQWLREGWEASIAQDGLIEVKVNMGAVTVYHTWGFEDIDGVRHHTRRLVYAGPEGKKLEKRLVYDYNGSNAA